MEIIPAVKSMQLAQLEPGDLFIIHDDTGSYVALAVKDPNQGGPLQLVIGPATKEVSEPPILTVFPSHITVVSFAKEYILRLPCDTKAWLPIEPPTGPCVILSGDKFYMRARYGGGGRVTPTYVSIKDGLLVANASGHFMRPRDDCAYAIQGSFLTAEKEPREIISFSPSP